MQARGRMQEAVRVVTLVSAYMRSNIHFLVEGGHAIVIDPADADLVAGEAEKARWKVDACILTHEHCDHTHGVDAVREKYHCPIIASKRCCANLGDSRKNLSRYYNAILEMQELVPKDTQNPMEPFTSAADVTFEREMTLSWMGHTLCLTETPGHSEGSICITVEDILFSGDSLLFDEETNTGYFGASERQLLSVTMPWLKTLPGNMLAYAGHGKSFRLSERLHE